MKPDATLQQQLNENNYYRLALVLGSPAPLLQEPSNTAFQRMCDGRYHVMHLCL